MQRSNRSTVREGKIRDTATTRDAATTKDKVLDVSEIKRAIPTHRHPRHHPLRQRNHLDQRRNDRKNRRDWGREYLAGPATAQAIPAAAVQAMPVAERDWEHPAERDREAQGKIGQPAA